NNVVNSLPSASMILIDTSARFPNRNETLNVSPDGFGNTLTLLSNLSLCILLPLEDRKGCKNHAAKNERVLRLASWADCACSFRLTVSAPRSCVRDVTTAVSKLNEETASCAANTTIPLASESEQTVKTTTVWRKSLFI